MINQSKVYQVVNNNMRSLNIVLYSFIFLSFLSFAQIIPPINSTLLEAVQTNSTNEQNLSKVYLTILQTHPELQNFSIISITSTTVNTTGTDYYVMLKGGNNSAIVVVVSFEANIQSYFVSYIKIDASGQQTANSATSSVPQHATSAVINNLQLSQAILTNNNAYVQTKPNRTFFSNLPGGFHPLNNFNDIKFKIAVGYLQQVHSNLINYQLISAQYQVVTGVNYLVRYEGFDEITRISAKINVGLDGIPFILDFNVSCKEPLVLECNDQLANEIFYGNEFVINSHPELLNYRLTSIYIQERTSTYTTFMSTFENAQLTLRAISEVMATDKVANVLSFYSYRF